MTEVGYGTGLATLPAKPKSGTGKPPFNGADTSGQAQGQFTHLLMQAA